jgi:predicted GH43/DUF377 family glycosyl hydrolase
MSAQTRLCRLETPSGVWTLDVSALNKSVRASVHAIDQPRRRLWQTQVALEPTRGKDLLARIAWRESKLLVRYRHRQRRFEISYSLHLEINPESAPAQRPVVSRREPVARTPPAALERCVRNPVLEPVPAHPWESQSVFNAAAVRIDQRVHVLYRAVGEDGLSVLGHAASEDGLRFGERSAQPVYTDRQTLAEYAASDQERRSVYQSGPSSYGCEDPRITRIDDRLYMTYTAFDGHNPPGVALTSIALTDLQAGRWRWSDPKLISEPHQAHKNWVLFPQRIDGRYAILHGISPTMQIDFFDDLEFRDGYRVRSRYVCSGNPGCWDNRIRGVGPPPIRTDAGWLLLYHAMDERDPGRYKIGAMLLDGDDPFRIIGRLPHPLLEPDARYENEGFKAGVVYACGAVLIDGRLHVYYGGADSVVCCASVALDRLLGQLQPIQSRALRRRERRPAHALAAA